MNFDLVVLDQRLALAGRRFLPLDLLGGVAELLGHIGGDVDVEPAHLAVGILQAEAGLVELGADHDGVLVTTATAAGRYRERQCDGQCDGAERTGAMDAMGRTAWWVPFAGALVASVLEDLSEEIFGALGTWDC